MSVVLRLNREAEPPPDDVMLSEEGVQESLAITLSRALRQGLENIGDSEIEALKQNGRVPVECSPQVITVDPDNPSKAVRQICKRVIECNDVEAILLAPDLPETDQITQLAETFGIQLIQPVADSHNPKKARQPQSFITLYDGSSEEEL